MFLTFPPVSSAFDATGRDAAAKAWVLLRIAAFISVVALFSFAKPSWPQDEGIIPAGSEDSVSGHEATLSYFNRPIITFRATILGLTPTERAERAHRRLVALDSGDLGRAIELSPIQYGNLKGYVISIGGQLLFGVAPKDLDPEQMSDIETLAQDARSKLADALAARLEQQRPGILLRGIAYTALGLIALFVAVWLIWRLRSTLVDKFHALISKRMRRAAGEGFDWARYGYALTARLAQLATTFAVVLFGYIWLGFSLKQFPVTRPVGERLKDFLVELALDLATRAADAIPGVVTAIVILLIAQALVQVTTNVMSAAEGGRVSLPFIRPDTASATRRILRTIIWCIALAIAYPYIPGSDSAAFQGLSVLIGVMVTLGSTGIVSQMMSGTVLVYSRALHLGEFVSTGDVEGVVTEMGSISTKLRTVRNEEITIPNSVLVEATIKNYSRQSGGASILLSTKVTIGYDTPWRQVHAMLMMAARETQGVLETPNSYVIQRALTDFYVEYELLFYTDRPLEQLLILSALHSKIQDIFNENGVQIMSPQYYEQPPQPLIVPKEKWYKPPAKKE